MNEPTNRGAVPRVMPASDYVRPSDGEPIRSAVLETEHCAIVVWHAYPGQEIAAHIHPHGQDTWTVLSGSADYFQGDGIVTRLHAGDIAIAKPGQTHGALNTDPAEPFIFVSVVAPGNAGYARVEK